MPLESPKGDAHRPGAIVAAARGCGWRCGCACPTGRLRDRPRRRGTAAARPQHRALSRFKVARRGSKSALVGVRHAKVFRRPGTNFRYRREPPSNFRVCPLFGTPPSIGAPGDLEKPLIHIESSFSLSVKDRTAYPRRHETPFRKRNFLIAFCLLPIQSTIVPVRKSVWKCGKAQSRRN